MLQDTNNITNGGHNIYLHTDTLTFWK